MADRGLFHGIIFSNIELLGPFIPEIGSLIVLIEPTENSSNLI
jgi:hypothetical protein